MACFSRTDLCSSCPEYFAEYACGSGTGIKYSFASLKTGFYIIEVRYNYGKKESAKGFDCVMDFCDCLGMCCS